MNTVITDFQFLSTFRTEAVPVNFFCTFLPTEITFIHNRILTPCQKKGNKLHIYMFNLDLCSWPGCKNHAYQDFRLCKTHKEMDYNKEIIHYLLSNTVITDLKAPGLFFEDLDLRGKIFINCFFHHTSWRNCRFDESRFQMCFFDDSIIQDSKSI
jgi:uncharacterized protein YjbI with pentapeptide repeats